MKQFLPDDDDDDDEAKGLGYHHYQYHRVYRDCGSQFIFKTQEVGRGVETVPTRRG